MYELIRVIVWAQERAKAIVAGAGSVLVALTALSADLGVQIIPEDAKGWIVFGLAALTAFSTWAVPNMEAVVRPDAD